jgi:imidazole glycerol phosphate synthase subunit HisF
VLAASIVHFGTFRVDEVKRELADAGYPVRLLSSGARR